MSWLKLAHHSPLQPVNQIEVVVRGVRILDEILTSPDGESFPPRYRRRMLRLLKEYVAICNLAETVFPIISGYRTPAWQAAYYRPGHVLHCEAYALDIGPTGDWTVGQMSAVAHHRRRQKDSWLVGIGMYPHWLHLDVRPRQCRQTWIGSPTCLD